jgi:hypothetical protein
MSVFKTYLKTPLIDDVDAIIVDYENNSLNNLTILMYHAIVLQYSSLKHHEQLHYCQFERKDILINQFKKVIEKSSAALEHKMTFTTIYLKELFKRIHAL